MEIKWIIIFLILIGMIGSASAISINDLTIRVIQPQSVYNSTVLGVKSNNVAWDGSQGQMKPIMVLEEGYIALPNDNSNITFSIYYGDKIINGTINQTNNNLIGFGNVVLGYNNIVDLGIGSDSSVNNIRTSTYREYKISYAKNNVTGHYGIAISDAWGPELYVYDTTGSLATQLKSVLGTGTYFITGGNPIASKLILGQIDASQVSNLIVGTAFLPQMAAFYDDDNVLSTPIWKIEIHSNNIIEATWIVDTNEKFQNDLITSGLSSNPIQVDIIKLLTNFYSTFSQIASGLYLFEVILISNAPWLFLGIEILGSTLVVWNGNGNIFKIITRWWDLQKRIVDFFMFIPRFVVENWILVLILFVISVIGWISSLSANPWEALNAAVKILIS